jgi:hypothetical protein
MTTPTGSPDESTDAILAERLGSLEAPDHQEDFWSDLTHRLEAEPVAAGPPPAGSQAGPARPTTVPETQVALLEPPLSLRRRNRFLVGIAAAVLVVGGGLGVAALLDDDSGSTGVVDVPEDTGPVTTDAPDTSDEPVDEQALPTSTVDPSDVSEATPDSYDYFAATTLVELGSGAVAGWTPDSTGVLLVDDAPGEELGSEGAELLTLWVQPVDGGERYLALPNGLTIQTGGADFAFGPNGSVSWVQWCDGFFCGMFTGKMAGDGHISDVTTVGVSIDDEHNVVDMAWSPDGTLWAVVSSFVPGALEPEFLLGSVAPGGAEVRFDAEAPAAIAVAAPGVDLLSSWVADDHAWLEDGDLGVAIGPASDNALVDLDGEFTDLAVVGSAIVLSGPSGVTVWTPEAVQEVTDLPVGALRLVPPGDSLVDGGSGVLVGLIESAAGDTSDGVASLLVSNSSGGLDFAPINAIPGYFGTRLAADGSAAAYTRLRDGFPVAFAERFTVAGAGVEELPRVVPPDGPACAGEPATASWGPAGISDAAEQTRSRLLDAALNCDYGLLAEIAGTDFTASFGGEDPLVVFTDGGPGLMNMLIALLGEPHVEALIGGEPDANYVWPVAFAKAVDEFGQYDEADLETMRNLGYTDADLAGFEEFGSYAGFRTAISASGQWLYFVEGD